MKTTDDSSELIKHIVDENIKKGIFIKEMSSNMHKSPQKIQEEYHREANINPREGKKEMKLQMIQKSILIHNCCPKIITVSEEAKFASTSAYCHYIKRNTGKTHMELCKYLKDGNRIL
jgi:AraC-like DNA-binding protein